MLAFAYAYHMRVPAVNKALHENVGAVRFNSSQTPAPLKFKEGRSF